MQRYGDASPEPLPYEMDQLLERELHEGERVVWAGQPNADRVFRMGFLIYLFAIPWLAITTMIGGGGAFMGGGLFGGFITLFMLPFYAIGFGMLAAPFWLRRQAKNTIYAVTDRRAFSSQPTLLSGRTVRSFGPTELQQITRTERSDGSGDLVFQEHITRDSDGDRRVTRHGFMGIPNVRQVDKIIREELLDRVNDPN